MNNQNENKDFINGSVVEHTGEYIHLEQIIKCMKTNRTVQIQRCIRSV